MKKARCYHCKKDFEGSTSRHIKRLERDHWEETGHRHYLGITGWTNHTLGPNPRFPDVDARPIVEWSPEENEPEPDYVTAEELESHLAAIPTHKDLAGWKKDLVNKTEFDRQFSYLSAKIASIPAFDPSMIPKMSSLDEAVVKQLKEKFGTIDQRLANHREVIDRFKDLEKRGIQDLRVTGLLSEWEKLEDRMDGMHEQIHRIQDEFDRTHKKLHDDIQMILETAKEWKDLVKNGEAKPTAEEHKAAVVKEIAERAAEVADGDALVVIPSVGKFAEFRALVMDNKTMNRDELVAEGVKAFGLSMEYCRSLIAVGVEEGWLVVKNIPAVRNPDGPLGGRPKRVITGSVEGDPRAPGATVLLKSERGGSPKA